VREAADELEDARRRRAAHRVRIVDRAIPPSFVRVVDEEVGLDAGEPRPDLVRNRPAFEQRVELRRPRKNR
jgi:hypothetical protein